MLGAIGLLEGKLVKIVGASSYRGGTYRCHLLEEPSIIFKVLPEKIKIIKNQKAVKVLYGS